MWLAESKFLAMSLHQQCFPFFHSQSTPTNAKEKTSENLTLLPPPMFLSNIIYTNKSHQLHQFQYVCFPLRMVKDWVFSFKGLGYFPPVFAQTPPFLSSTPKKTAPNRQPGDLPRGSLALRQWPIKEIWHTSDPTVRCSLLPKRLGFFGDLKKNKPMLNPNSYAIITGKNQWGIQTDRDLQGTLT